MPAPHCFPFETVPNLSDDAALNWLSFFFSLFHQRADNEALTTDSATRLKNCELECR